MQICLGVGPAGATGVVQCPRGSFRAIFLQNSSPSAWGAFELPLARDPAHGGGAPHIFGARRQQRGQWNVGALEWALRTQAESRGQAG